MQLCFFSKHLASSSIEQMAVALRAVGLDSVDLTVRPNSHIAPERVEEELPHAYEVLRAQGIRIAMITTNLTDAHDPLTTKVLSTAARCGISHYKLGYYSYAGFGTIRQQRQEVRAKLRDMAELNAQLGIVGGYHNHSHNFFGAALGDIDYALQDADARWMGCYFDVAHASIEGGSSGWLQGLDLLAERIVMLAVKDYAWTQNKGYAGGRRFHVDWQPLETGNTPWPQALRCLRQVNFQGPVSFHAEYQDNPAYAEPETYLQEVARDVKLFRQWMAEAGLQEDAA
jgi:L-ribulose-5-phosphate 3-epimerase